MGLSWAIKKLSLISKLKLLESLDKMVKSLKFTLQSEVIKWSEIAVCQTQSSHMFSWSDVKAFCLAVINSVAAITLKTKSNTRAYLVKSISLKRKWLTILDGNFENGFSNMA